MAKMTLVFLTLFTFHSYAEHGANLNLFPPKQADVSRAQRPAKPQLTEPTYKAKVSGDAVTLKWQPVAMADSYHVQVATDINFKWLISDEWKVSGNFFEQKGLEKGKTYYWRVAGVKSDNVPTRMKGWFTVNTFTVN
jgi:hypothetical protein